MRKVPWMLAAITLLIATPAWAQLKTEVLPLRNRAVQEMIPVIRPLLGPQGVVTGMSGQLIVKATPQNLETVKEVLRQLDTAPRNLRITVHQGRLEDLDAFDAAVSAEVGLGKKGRITINPRGTASGTVGGGLSGGDREVRGTLGSVQSQSDRTRRQQVVTLEGHPAVIHVTQTIPFNETRSVRSGINSLEEKTVVFRNVTTGLRVLPRLQGDRVILEIDPVVSELREDGGIETQTVGTTVAGQLGEWIEIGGLLQSGTTSNRGILERSRSDRQDTRSVYIRVDEQ